MKIVDTAVENRRTVRDSESNVQNILITTTLQQYITHYLLVRQTHRLRPVIMKSVRTFTVMRTYKGYRNATRSLCHVFRWTFAPNAHTHPSTARSLGYPIPRVRINFTHHSVVGSTNAFIVPSPYTPEERHPVSRFGTAMRRAPSKSNMSNFHVPPTGPIGLLVSALPMPPLVENVSLNVIVCFLERFMHKIVIRNALSSYTGTDWKLTTSTNLLLFSLIFNGYFLKIQKITQRNNMFEILLMHNSYRIKSQSNQFLYSNFARIPYNI
jgi:hypothetical protein